MFASGSHSSLCSGFGQSSVITTSTSLECWRKMAPLRSLSPYFIVALLLIYLLPVKSFSRDANAKEKDENNSGVNLVFAVNTKASMYDDLPHLKAVIRRLYSLSGRPSSGAANRQRSSPSSMLMPKSDVDRLALLKFDNGVLPEVVLSDQDDFDRFLDELSTDADTGCQSRSLAATLKALDVSQRRSTVFIFTDGPASDHVLLNRVIAKVIEQQTQVIFVVSGQCGDLSSKGYEVYDRIASYSSGLVLRFAKSELSRALELVEATIQRDKVYLLAAEASQGGTHAYSFMVDKHIRKVVVSVSDTNVKLDTRSPSNTITRHRRIAVNLPSIKVETIDQPEVGVWNVTVTSVGPHNLRVTAESNVDVDYGFHLRRLTDTKEAALSLMPIEGIANYLYVSFTGISDNGTSLLSSVDIIGIDGHLIASHRLQGPQLHDGSFVIYFSPVRQPFLLRFKGIDDGFRFSRVSPAMIKSRPPDPPAIQLQKNFVAYVGASVILYCFVESAIPFTVVWQREGVSLDEPSAYVKSVNTSLWLPAKSTDESGMYTCAAASSVGVSSMTTNVIIKVRPPIISVINDQSALLGETVLLRCEIYSYTNERMHKAWHKNNLPISFDNRVRLTPDADLWIGNAQTGDAGLYNCSAKNSGGKSSRQFHLQVEGEASVSVEARPQHFKAGETVSILCNTIGHQLPLISWFKNGRPLSFSKRIQARTKQEIKIITAAQNDEGTYKCVADYSSVAGIQGNRVVSAKSWIAFQDPPHVRVLPLEQTLLDGASFSIQCLVTGSPTPNITWSKDGRVLSSNSRLQFLGNGVLHVPHTTADDTGTYFCEARNQHGIDAGFGRLYVGSAPSIANSSPMDGLYELGSNVTLSCVASGNPQPFIYWLDSNEQDASKDAGIHQTDDGRLLFTSLSVHHTGKYTCKAQNQFGETSAEHLITVTGIEAPVISPFSVEKLVATAGNNISMPCIASGNPTPVVTWYKKGSEVEVLKENFMTSSSGTLHITHASPHSSGVYVCKAVNSAGIVEEERSVLVAVPPVIEIQSEGVLHVNEGDTAHLECYATGIPEPLVTWQRNGNLLPHIGHSIHINDISEVDNGTYKCEAENQAGLAWSSIVVFVRKFKDVDIHLGNEALESEVQEIPRFDVTPRSARINAGETASFFCNATGNPAPRIKWQRSVVATSETLELSPDNQLVIRNARIEDSGPYSCSAENDVGTLMTVFQILVKVDGALGPWRDWDTCNASCGIGFQSRVRLCDSPPPRNGGRGCEGATRQIRSCSSKPCDVDGEYGDWSDWSTCSRSCGGGQYFRIRLCDSPPPSGNGEQCDGESLQAAVCNDYPCAGEDVILEVIGALTGEVNGVKIVEGAIMANLTHTQNTTKITLHVKNIPQQLVKVMRSVTSLLTPIYWAVIKQSAFEDSGIDLAGGALRYTGQIVYGTYQSLRCDATVRVIPGNQVLMIEAELHGNAQVFPRSHDVIPLGFEEQFIQVGNGKIYGTSERRIKVGNLPVGYSFNHSFEYPSTSTMKNVLASYSVGKMTIRDNIKDRSLRYDFEAAFTEGSDVCPFGFVKRDGFCADIDECDKAFCQHFCTNSYGSYTCQCLAGFYLGPDSLTCKDIDECSLAVHECDDTQECLNLPGGYECNDKPCEPGFQRDETTKECNDMNECLTFRPCPSSEQCINVLGSYKCEISPCASGYERSSSDNNATCQDIDECASEVNPCQPGETCINTAGSHFCFIVACDNGYERLSNGTCIDIDECLSIGGACPTGFVCLNSIGSYSCHVRPCEPGFERNITSSTCVDVNECLSGKHNCTDDEMCSNIRGSFRCPPLPCLAGYERDANRTCVDVDECKLDPCGPGELCKNSDGSFFCEFLICQNGYEYTLDFTACQDIDECRDENSCPQFYACLNFPGGYKCDGPICPPGYTDGGNGSCLDTNECILPGRICPETMACINLNGSYTCTCPEGFVLSSTFSGVCEDVDECSSSHNCTTSQVCVNSEGGYYCKSLLKSTLAPLTPVEQLLSTVPPPSALTSQPPIGSNTKASQPVENSVEYGDPQAPLVTVRPTSYFEEHQVVAATDNLLPGEYELGLNIIGGLTTDNTPEQSIEGEPVGGTPFSSTKQGTTASSQPKIATDAINTADPPTTTVSTATERELVSTQSRSSSPQASTVISTQNILNSDTNTTPVALTISEVSSRTNTPSSPVPAVDDSTPARNEETTTPAPSVPANPVTREISTSGEVTEQQTTEARDSSSAAMDIGTTSSSTAFVPVMVTTQVSPTRDNSLPPTTETATTTPIAETTATTTSEPITTDAATTKEGIVTVKTVESAAKTTAATTVAITDGSRVTTSAMKDNPTTKPDDEGPTEEENRVELVCGKGFEPGTDGKCQDIDECAPTANPCGDKKCINVRGSFRCARYCRQGYRRSTTGVCSDVNECNEKKKPCGDDQLCFNLAGGYRCVCRRGFRMRAQDKMCIDIDECLIKNFQVCQHNCINTLGSFRCECGSGFLLLKDGRTCQVGEVRAGELQDRTRLTETRIRTMAHTGQCFMFGGKKLCFCPHGYKWNHERAVCENLLDMLGMSKPVLAKAKLPDENNFPTTSSPTAINPNVPGVASNVVQPDPSIPSPNAGTRMEEAKVPGSTPACPSWYAKRCAHECSIVRGQYSCTCPTGYNLSYYGGCRDVNECWQGQTMCPSDNQECFNTRGSHRCVSYSCPVGFYQFRKGYCEKSCRIGKYGFCRRNYIRYYTIALDRTKAIDDNVLTLRVAQFMTGRMNRVQFYFTRSNSYFCLTEQTTQARMRVCRAFTSSGNYDVEINADIFDDRDRLVCRTKFIVYVSVGDHAF